MYNCNTDSLGLILGVEVFFSEGHCSGALWGRSYFTNNHVEFGNNLSATDNIDMSEHWTPYSFVIVSDDVLSNHCFSLHTNLLFKSLISLSGWKCVKCVGSAPLHKSRTSGHGNEWRRSFSINWILMDDGFRFGVSEESGPCAALDTAPPNLRARLNGTQNQIKWQKMDRDNVNRTMNRILWPHKLHLYEQC